LGLRLREGMWVQAEGVVYDGWSDALHMVERMPEGWHAWRKIRSIDFGYVNPFVCQWWAVDNDGRMFRYREIYMTKRTVADHAAKINLLSQGESYEATICDHDAEDRATLKQAGISSVNATKEVSRGIQAVQQRLERGHDDKPRLYLLRNALVERDPALVEERRPLCTEQEMSAYVWQTTPDGKPDKEEPMKLNDHGADCLRYAVMYLDGKPPRRTGGSYRA
jgi:phage terminase large subunit